MFNDKEESDDFYICYLYYSRSDSNLRHSDSNPGYAI